MLDEEPETDQRDAGYLRKRGQTRRIQEVPPLTDQPHEPLPPRADVTPSEPNRRTSWLDRLDLIGHRRKRQSQ